MALTRDFKETIRARAKRDPGFRKALLREGIENFLSGDVETGEDHSSRFHQCHGWIHQTEWRYPSLGEKPHADARPPAAIPRLATCLKSSPICSERRVCALRFVPRARHRARRGGHPPRIERGSFLLWLGVRNEPQTETSEKHPPRLPIVQASQDEWGGQDVSRSRLKSPDGQKSIKTAHHGLMIARNAGPSWVTPALVVAAFRGGRLSLLPNVALAF